MSTHLPSVRPGKHLRLRRSDVVSRFDLEVSADEAEAKRGDGALRAHFEGRDGVVEGEFGLSGSSSGGVARSCLSCSISWTMSGRCRRKTRRSGGVTWS